MLSRAGGAIVAWQIAAAIILLCLTKLILEAIYRVTLHPLARFPGPILAALSYKYEFYFDGIKGGQYTNEIARLHRIYGTKWLSPLRRGSNSLQGRLSALILMNCTVMTQTLSIRSMLVPVRGGISRVTGWTALGQGKRRSKNFLYALLTEL
jgi:hypothetical protein